MSSERENPKIDSVKIMLSGALTGAFMTLPAYSWMFAKNWDWAEGFPLGWLGVGLSYMAIFFHELGHTITAWFYGYPALPSFDFQHGGGMAWLLGNQQILILAMLYIAIIYGVVKFKEWRSIQIVLGMLLILNLATAFFEDARFVMIDFMGPAAVPLVAAFLLIRALFDLAPRGWFERFLNAVFGFGLIFLSLLECYGLLQSKAYRLVYFEQKGQHGFGDFDKMAARLPSLDFADVVSLWAGLNVLCLIVPFVLYFALRHRLTS